MHTCIKHMLPVVALSALSGCASMNTRLGGREELPQYIYPGTQLDVEQILHPRDYQMIDPCVTAVSWIFPLFYLVDLPLSFVLDTVLLPYDLYQTKIRGNDRYRGASTMAFWDGVFQANAIAHSFQCYQENLTDMGARRIAAELKQDTRLHISAEVLAMLCDLCTSDTPQWPNAGYWMRHILELLSRNPNLPTNSVAKIYVYAQNDPSRHSLLVAIASHPKLPLSSLQELAQDQDLIILRQLALNPQTPSDTLVLVAITALASLKANKSPYDGTAVLLWVVQHPAMPDKVRIQVEVELRALLDENTTTADPRRFLHDSDWRQRARDVITEANKKNRED